MRDVHTSKRNRKKSLILQGIKPHRAKECNGLWRPEKSENK